MAIKLEVQQYCSECLDFTPDVTKPERSKLYSYDGEVHTIQTDTLVRCSYAKRCENIRRYLEKIERGDNTHE